MSSTCPRSSCSTLRSILTSQPPTIDLDATDTSSKVNHDESNQIQQINSPVGRKRRRKCNLLAEVDQFDNHDSNIESCQTLELNQSGSRQRRKGGSTNHIFHCPTALANQTRSTLSSHSCSTHSSTGTKPLNELRSRIGDSIKNNFIPVNPAARRGVKVSKSATPTTNASRLVISSRPSSDNDFLSPSPQTAFSSSSSCSSSWDTVVESAELDSPDSSFELYEDFLSFLEHGNVSTDLEVYFNQLASSFQDPHDMKQSVQNNTTSSSTAISTQSLLLPNQDSRRLVHDDDSQSKDLSSSASWIQEKRQRNNEASRRSRAAHKAKFDHLAIELSRLDEENNELTIWCRELDRILSLSKRILRQHIKTNTKEQIQTFS